MDSLSFLARLSRDVRRQPNMTLQLPSSSRDSRTFSGVLLTHMLPRQRVAVWAARYHALRAPGPFRFRPFEIVPKVSYKPSVVEKLASER